VVDQDRAEDTLGFGQDVLERLFYVLFGIRKRDDADGGTLPHVMKIELGDSDVEFAAETVFEATEDLALVLQRVCVGNLELQDE
jgi:hypothetical protein